MHEITTLWLELPLSLLHAVNMCDKQCKLHYAILTVHPSLLGLSDEQDINSANLLLFELKQTRLCRLIS